MGRVLGAYGVKGWLKIQPFTDSPENLCAYSTWALNLRDAWRDCAIAHCKVQGTHLVAQIAGCDTREAAALYRGAEIAIDRNELPEPEAGEVYESDLIGLQIVNREGQCLGNVSEIFSNGAHPVMRVVLEKRERLLPVIAQVLISVDLADGKIFVDWGEDW